MSGLFIDLKPYWTQHIVALAVLEGKLYVRFQQSVTIDSKGNKVPYIVLDANSLEELALPEDKPEEEKSSL